MKWIGQHIWDFITRFRNQVYFEKISSGTPNAFISVDSDKKVITGGKAASTTVSGIVELATTAETTTKVIVSRTVTHTEFNTGSPTDSDGAVTLNGGSVNVQIAKLESGQAIFLRTNFKNRKKTVIIHFKNQQLTSISKAFKKVKP